MQQCLIVIMLMQVLLYFDANHKMVGVKIKGLDNSDVVVQCIQQDEPLNTNGDGNTEFDAIDAEAFSFFVRAERMGGGNRVDITYPIEQPS